jgi:cation-dependent mannose-6-phosphate receptor
MFPPSLTSILLVALALQAPMTQAASDDKPVDTIPCTAKSPSTHGFYDLRPLAVEMVDPKKKTGKDKTDSWQAKGHDYNGNFTLNVCAPVVEDIKDVVGIEKPLWKNVSAYYDVNGKVFSIG